MTRRCPFCHSQMDIPERAETGGYCGCGAYAHIHALSRAGLFTAQARKALGVEPGWKGHRLEVVDGGIVFEEGEDPFIIQWAKAPF
jgi:hypothetical protein